MKLILKIAGIFAFGINFTQAQTTLCLGEDATVCAGTSVTINNCSGGPGGSNSIYLDNPTTISLSDDQWSGLINMQFPFSFYGQSYNQCVIGSNGLISFDASEAGGYCAWNLGGAGTLPNPGFDDALNSVMVAYQDLLPSNGGTIQYQTIGTAPNRIFVVLYQDLQYFSSSCSGLCNYMAAAFYETSNIVEIHIGNKPSCIQWNSGLGITGIQNATGTNAVIVSGANNSVYDLNQTAFQFTPTSPANTSNYTLTNIPYVLFTSPTSSQQWETTTGQTYPYNNGTLTFTATEPGPIGYFVSGDACGASLGSVSDTTWITVVSSSVSATAVDDICSALIGSVTATPTGGIAPFTFSWPALGGNSATVNNVGAGTYTVNMVDGNGCASSTNVTVGDVPATYTNSYTQVSCPGGSDGTATANMNPIIGNVTYLWDDPNAQTTPTATGLIAGTYNCTITSDVGCSQVVTVIVDEIPGMVLTVEDIQDVTCNSGNNGIIEVSIVDGTTPYSYSWDNSVSTDSIADDLYAGLHTLTVTDNNGCIIDTSIQINEPASLTITSLTPNTQICPEDDITLSVTGSGGSSPYTFTWTENGTEIGTGTSILVDPDETNTNYCVTLTEECGSPSTQECTIVYFPTPIEPALTSAYYEDCIPGEFDFENSSSNREEIATTYIDFGDGNNGIYNGYDSISHTFNNVGQYSFYMVTTSIYGCVYEDSLIDFVSVVPNPTAKFAFSDNPATVFETEVSTTDLSSIDVVGWEWFSPGSTPSTSTEQDQTWTFPEGIEGVYPVTLVVTSNYGCTDTSTLILVIEDDILFFAPNAFTPDGDEFNQDWKISLKGTDIYEFELLIFNRWGEVIFESHDPNVAWDGTKNGQKVQTGTYVWKAYVKNKDDDGKQEFTGYVTILR